MKILKMLIVGLIMVVFISCNHTKKGEVKDTLKIGLAYKPRSSDPQSHTDSSTLAVTKQIYSNLFSLGEKGEVIPELVENYKILPDNSIELILRKGVLFHNGDELTAEDVKKSLLRNLSIPVSKVLVHSIRGVDVLDKYKLRINQHNAPSILLHNLTHSSTAIVKEVKDNKNGINFVGTGGYKITDWKEAERIKLKSFDNFYLGKPKIENIVFLTIPEASSRMIGLETGELDIAYDIATSDIKRINSTKNLKVINKQSLGTDFVTINTKKVTDKRVRQAIEYAIDKQAIINAVYDGYSSIPNSILTSPVFGYNESLKSREYNLKKAKELMREAGVKNLKLDLWIYAEPTREQMAQIIQADLKEIGIDINIQVAEVPTFLQFTGAGKHDLLIGLWYISTGDADYGYYPLLHSSSLGNIGNRSFYSNKEVDRHLDNARTHFSKVGREKEYTEAQKIILDEVPLFPISCKNYTIGLGKNIEGFIFNPSGNHTLYKTYFKQ